MDNDEPLYRYVKGQGWVPGVAPLDYVFDDGRGKRWLVQERMPVHGEFWTAFNETTKSIQTYLLEYKHYKVEHIFGTWDRVNAVLYKRYFTFVPL